MAGICKKADAKHMNHIIIKQGEQIDARIMGQGDNRFAVKPVVDGEDVALCGVNIVEVEPGCTAYGYHYHEANEEVFCILSGTATVRTPQGEKEVPAGGIIAFPAGAAGAHVVQNRGSEKLVYIDFGTRRTPDLVHFPDAGAGWACSADGRIYDFSEK